MKNGAGKATNSSEYDDTRSGEKKPAEKPLLSKDLGFQSKPDGII
jgi:hypothetical protein